MTDPAPRVSVVIIFLNGERYLAEAIDSVLAQTYRSFELILVDDGSTDGATAIAKGYAAREPGRVRYLEHPGHANHGMSASRNAGIAIARGEYVAFNDADDVWLPEKLADQVALADANPEAGMIAGGANYWESWEGGEDIVIIPGSVLDQVIPVPEALLGIYPIGPAEAPCPSTLLCRKSALEAIGGFEESYRGMYEDQAFLAKMYLSSPVYFPDRCWLNYRQHFDSCSSGIAREGTMMQIRTKFFRWLEDYCHRTGMTDPRVLAAVRRARRRHAREAALWRIKPRNWPRRIREPLRRLKQLARGARTPAAG